MTKVIAIINQKGGVGKSTTALALAAGLRLRGQRVLSVDLDAQGNLSYSMGADGEGASVYDALRGEAQLSEVLRHTPQGDLLPSGRALAGADAVLVEVGKEYRLSELLAGVSEDYDTILIDTPPALGILTVNALTACNGVVIPAQADMYSLQGIAQLQGTVDTVRRYCNPALKVRGVLLTRYNPRAILSREFAEMIGEAATRLGARLYETNIREAIAIKEAQASQQSLFEYAPKSNAAVDYDAFVEEFIKEQAEYAAQRA